MNDLLLVSRLEHLERLQHDGRDGLQREPPSGRFGQPLHAVPFEQLHDDEGGPVLGDIVVDGPYGARVLHLVGEVPFPKEPGSHLRTHRQLRVEHLDGKVGAVPVRCPVDHRHPADADHAGEPILAARDLAKPRAGTPLQVVG